MGLGAGQPGRTHPRRAWTNPPETALAEIYNVPADKGFSPRGADVDKNGVAWTVLSSGQLASFDRRKCKGPLNGPNAASGNACPEGWTFYAVPGPNFKGDVVSAAADSNYYNWSDKFNSLGLGENVQIATSNLGGALLALVDGNWVVLRVPYPLGFYAKSINGRIDDPKTGWKGRGLWTGWSNRNPWHNEGGKGKSSMAVHFQVRPDRWRSRRSLSDVNPLLAQVHPSRRFSSSFAFCSPSIGATARVRQPAVKGDPEAAKMKNPVDATPDRSPPARRLSRLSALPATATRARVARPLGDPS